MDIQFFKDILSVESTSGCERALAEQLFDRIEAPKKEKFEVGDGTLNLLFTWGTPKVVFCTHMDTVPPYIAPEFDGDEVRGRGSCDAKGQIFAMYTACKELEAKGETGFALLLLSGEETGSWGAKSFDKTGFKAPLLVIGEPTEGFPVSASKGTKSYDLKFKGRPFHSGYPELGRSAVEMWMDWMIRLEIESEFPKDKILGETTWNVGLVKSDNPQNVLSPELTCRIYFRTTFATDKMVEKYMAGNWIDVEVNPRGGDAPAMYYVPEGFKGKPVAFGSDAPHLNGFERKMICGPGSIRFAHRDDEHISLTEIEQAVQTYIDIFKTL